MKLALKNVRVDQTVRFYREDLAEKVKEDFALLKRELRKL